MVFNYLNESALSKNMEKKPTPEVPFRRVMINGDDEKVKKDTAKYFSTVNPYID